MKKLFENIKWAHSLASLAEKECKVLWKLFGLAFAAGIMLQSFILFSIFGGLGIVGGIGLILLGLVYVWSFWLEVGLTSYRARSYILGQVNTIIQGMVAVWKEGGKEDKQVVH